MTDLRKAAQEAAKVLANALSIDFNDKRDWYSYKHDVEYATNLLLQALAQHEQDDEAYGYAKYLAECIWEKHYKEESPHWRPFDNTLGVLTQIDNMTCGLEKAQHEHETNWWDDKEYVKNRFGAAAKVVDVRRGLPAGSFKPISEPVKERISEPVKNFEPVAWLWLHQGEPVNALMFNPSDKDEHFKKKGFSSKPLYTAPPKQWVGLTDEEREQATGWSVEHIEAKLKEKNA